MADGTYPDPFASDNLRNLPGAAYDTNQNFLLEPMPKNSPFACSWWYRTEFTPAEAVKNRFVTLRFAGINNHANIWLNGRRIADASEISSADRAYEFNITPLLRPEGPNALAVEIFAPAPNDFAINWIDWNPAPPDKDMGLWRGVELDTTGPVEIESAQVLTHFPSESLDTADLTPEAALKNVTRHSLHGMLQAEMEGVRLEQRVDLKPGQSKNVRFTPQQFPELRLKNPSLWWPAQMGEPALHNLTVRFIAGRAVSDEKSIRFGIREITSEIDDHGNRLFRVNGKKIFIRGAGWAPDMLLREQPERLRAEFDYVRDLNLNTIRLEGKLETDDFFNLADERGVLVMPGWSCCDRWQDGEKWNSAELLAATATLNSQALRLRSHPSVLAWLNGSDKGPPANVERAFLETLRQTDWPDPILFSASEDPSTISGATGVKMTGPYDYVPPDFWLTDDGRNGGAAGFNMETSPGPAIPEKQSLEKMLGRPHLSLTDALWEFHTAQGTFSKLDHFNQAMAAIYGPPRDLEDYERKAQIMAYDSERAMFEAYTRNKYAATTGIIQWMLNNAWPSLFWHLYDYYLEPAGGYFGAKKALEPLHIQYSYPDRAVVVVNNTYAAASEMQVKADLYAQNLHEVFSQTVQTDLAPDSAVNVLTLPGDVFGPDRAVAFLRLTLDDSHGRPVSSNFYWLASHSNVYDWSRASFRYTPVSAYSDLTALEKLEPAKIKADYNPRSAASARAVSFTVTNFGASLALQIRLSLCRKSDGSEIVPITWTDNYFTLLPGEARTVSAQILSEDLRSDLDLMITGWNIAPERIRLSEQ